MIEGGVYSSVKPVGVCVDKLLNLLQSVKHIKPKVDKLHCTVLFSRNEDSAVGVTKSKPVHLATIKEFTSWVGHDDKPYLIALLDSADLQKAFKSWTDLGYTSDFPIYKPHITIQKNLDDDVCADAIQTLNEQLKRAPFVLSFGREIVAPLED